MDTIRSFFTTVGTSSGGQIPRALQKLARHVLWDHPVADDAEACRDVVQSLVTRAIGDVGAGRMTIWRELATMDDRLLMGTLAVRMLQIASEQDPLRRERRALTQHVRRALAEDASENHSPPGRIMDDHGRFSYALIKDAVAWALSSPDGPDRNAGAVTSRLIRSFLPGREHGVSEHRQEAASDGEDSDSQMRRSLDGPEMVRELVGILTPKVARVFSMSLAGATYDQIAVSEGIPITTLHRWVKKGEALISDYVTRVGLGRGSARHVFRLIALIGRDTPWDLRVRDDIRTVLARAPESRALAAADPAVGRRGEFP